MPQRRLLHLAVLAALLLTFTLSVHAADYAELDALILTKDVPKIQSAIDGLKELLGQNPDDGEALWLLSKAYLYLGDRTEEGRLKVFETGKKYADQAVETVPDNPHAHYWLSALLGRIGQTRGILSSLSMVRPMKEALDRVLELDENYAAAYWVLSQLYQQAPGFPLSIGNKKLALENARRAVELAPEDLEFQLQLAKALEHNGQKAEAKAVLEEIRSNPRLKDDSDLQKEAEELHAKWQ